MSERCWPHGRTRFAQRGPLSSFAKQGDQKREEIVGDELRAFGGGVDSVVLNGAGDGVDVSVELGQERNVEFGGEEAIGFVELLDVVGAVVGREGNAGEDDFAAGLEQGGDDGVEVAARVGDGDATEAVVAAEFNDDDGGVEAEDFFQAVDAVFGGVAADARIDDFVVVAATVEVGLEIVGIGLAGSDAIAGGDAVSEAGDNGNGAGRGSVCGEGEKKRGDEGEAGHEMRNTRSFTASAR
jgi:hypothetical protein